MFMKKVIHIENSGLIKATLNLILYEKNELADLETEYETEIAKTIISLKPQTEVDYKLAEMQAKVNHKELANKILKQQNNIESLYMTLDHKEEVMEEFKKFEAEMQENFELLKKIIGDD